MYGDVVMGMKPESKEDIDPFEEIIEQVKEEKGVEDDTDLTTGDLKDLVKRFKDAVKRKTGKDFPTDPWEQLWGAVVAVFDSWGKQIPKYQGQYDEVKKIVLSDAPPEAVFAHGFTEVGELRKVPREEW